jgi:predicted ATPase
MTPEEVRVTDGRSQAWPAGLPIPLTSFIGRGDQRRQVSQLVAGARLVTLVGAGGVGKTRLAIEVAARAADSFAQGVDFVDLASHRDPATLPSVVARCLGLEQRADVEEHLVRYLRLQRRLLVLDNCEHLRVGCADLVRSLLTRCPHLTVLATSRDNLGVIGEISWRVPSLSFPWPDRPCAMEDLETYEAVALFLDRGRAALAGLAVAPGEVNALIRICYQLDGIPLALELAAARMRALTVSEIAERISGRFDLLGAGGVGRADTRRWRRRSSGAISFSIPRKRPCSAGSECSLAVGPWNPSKPLQPPHQ